MELLPQTGVAEGVDEGFGSCVPVKGATAIVDRADPGLAEVGPRQRARGAGRPGKGEQLVGDLRRFVVAPEVDEVPAASNERVRPVLDRPRTCQASRLLRGTEGAVDVTLKNPREAQHDVRVAKVGVELDRRLRLLAATGRVGDGED